MNDCPTCGGEGCALGYLGEIFWLRCRNCGIDFIGDHYEEEETED